MKILIISFYFPPDLSAGSFRSKSLVKALLKNNKNVEIEVFTTTPNRYKSFEDFSKDDFNDARVKVHKFQIPDHKNGIIDQAKSFFVFAKAVLKESKNKRWDMVFATSSRLMTASLGAEISRRKNIPLYLDIRDLFIDSIKSIYMKNIAIRSLIPFLTLLEKYTFKKATKINLVSAGFNSYVSQIVNDSKITNFTNGIDANFLNYNFENLHQKSNKIEFLYAGNIGIGQGLEKVLPAAAKKLKNKINFKIIGDGSARENLEKAIAENNISNIELINPINRINLMSYYKDADILFLHLNDFDAYRKVLPSKLFEYASTNKPILAGVSGYAKDFIINNIDHAEVFYPCNENEMIEKLEKICKYNTIINRNNFSIKFSRESIMINMAKDIMDIKNV